MPWKLVGFIVCLVLGTCFAGFNLGNSCNISFGFRTFENVPIFFSLIVAFALGVVVTLPFTVIRRKSAKEKKELAEQKAMKKIQRNQDKAAKLAEKEAKASAKAEKAAAKEARQAEKEAKRLERQQNQPHKANAAASVPAGTFGAGGAGAGAGSAGASGTSTGNPSDSSRRG